MDPLYADLPVRCMLRDATLEKTNADFAEVARGAHNKARTTGECRFNFICINGWLLTEY